MNKVNAKLRREALSHKSRDLPDTDVSEHERGCYVGVETCIELIRQQPFRELYLGGQTYKYIQLGELLDSIRLHFGVDDD
jgi:hypothetical protein